jgi:hypothetical protein
MIPGILKLKKYWKDCTGPEINNSASNAVPSKILVRFLPCLITAMDTGNEANKNIMIIRGR